MLDGARLDLSTLCQLLFVAPLKLAFEPRLERHSSNTIFDLHNFTQFGLIRYSDIQLEPIILKENDSGRKIFRWSRVKSYETLSATDEK